LPVNNGARLLSWLPGSTVAGLLSWLPGSTVAGLLGWLPCPRLELDRFFEWMFAYEVDLCTHRSRPPVCGANCQQQTEQTTSLPCNHSKGLACT
jgi:hypothetical protein